MQRNDSKNILRNRDLSIGSERELDDLATRSLISTDLDFLKERGDSMDDKNATESYLDMYRPGTAKPPHHNSGVIDQSRPSQQNDDARQTASRPQEQRNPRSFTQWSIDASESSETGPLVGTSMKKATLPEVEIVKSEEASPRDGEGGPRLPRYNSHASYSEMIDNMSKEDPFKGEYLPSGKTRSSSRIPKKKRGKEQSSDSIPLGRLSETVPDQEPRKLKKRKKHSHRHGAQGSESMNSTGTYTVDVPDTVGIINEGYEGTGKRTRKGHNSVGEDRVSNATFTVSENEQESQGLKESFNKFVNKLHTVKIPPKHVGSNTSMSEKAVADFISKKIFQRECKQYARDKRAQYNACQCGRTTQWHEERAMSIRHKQEPEIWSMKTHTDTMPCDSFGEICFRGFGHDVTNSPYVRLDPITDLEDVWVILTDMWALPIPKLLISVTGGAKRFDLKPRLRNLLKEGLCNAAASTGAWIITGGTSAGVMEFVGEAVRDYIAATGNPEQNKVIALGIATWGIVANRFALDGEGDRGLFPATYTVEDVEASGSSSSALDHNHTHFILVDDGTEGKYGAEIKFRTKLESYISKKVETGVAQSQSVHVPNVLIVVEGGVNTMRTVSESIQRKTPVVVIEGSGRAAEYIAYGFNLTRSKDEGEKTVFPPDFDEIMLTKARSMFVWKKSETELDKKIHECLRNLKACLEHRRLINVFNLEAADSNKDIDRAILYALLKANKSNGNSQLALALAWNRCDIARQEIFSTSNRKHWQKIDLYDATVTALVQDRADFVQLFIDNGLDIKRFLTIPTLWNLYANVINDMGDNNADLIRNLLAYHKQTWAAYLCCQGATRWQNSPDLLKYIGRVIIHLLRDQSMLPYSDDRYLVRGEKGPSLKWLGDRTKTKSLISRISTRDTGDALLSSRRPKLKVQEEFDFKNPEKELFLWAVLFNRRQMAHLFWKLGKDHLTSALVACSILKMMSDVAEDEEELDLSADLQDHAMEMEKHSCEVLSECYGRDKRATHQLLVCEQKQWGNSTLLQLADTHTLMNFVEITPCQTKLNDIWKGRMALYTPELKIILSILFPFLLPTIKFTSNNSVVDMLEGNDSDEEEFIDDNIHESNPDSQGPHTRRGSKPNQIEPREGDEGDVDFSLAKSRRKKRNKKTKLYSVSFTDFRSSDINIFTAIFYFYAAPVTKFYCNVGSYLAFLCIFSYFVLIDLRPVTEVNSPSIFEIITWIWLSTMLLEEGRQIFIRDQRSLKYKIQSWFSNIWNRFDLLIYSLFILSIVLRYNLFTNDFTWARMSYSITLAFFYLRFTQFFFAFRNMGPKVIMIRKMLTDLMFFFFILLVFMISFGVAYHVNLYPNHEPNYKVFVNILYLPYWQMYGELFLERVQGEDDPSGCTRNETLWRADLLPRCPEQNFLVSILLAIYMILSNILLVNLLIAMFSYTFQTVQDNSLKIWRFYRLSLVYEYFDRPTLVPPIIILNHLYRLLMWIINHCCQNCKRRNYFRREVGPTTTLAGKIEERLDEKEYVRLQMFEKAAMEKYLSRSLMLRREQLDNKVANTAERIENVMHELALIKETVMESGPRSSGLSETQAEQLALLEQFQKSGPPQNRPSTNETAYLRQCVDDLAEQVGQHTLKMSQMMNLLELMVSNQVQTSVQSHGQWSRNTSGQLALAEVSPTDEDA